MSRILIALQGHLFRRSVLNATFNYCRDMKFNVSVLLVDSEDEPHPLLMDFLARLKQAGLNGSPYRQTGPLGQAILRHANRFKDIRLILVDNMKHWGAGVSLSALSQPVGLLSAASS